MKDKRSILIVDDNELNRELLSDILSDEYRVFEAGNGREALELLRSVSDEISIILLDLIMPVMDGFSVLDRLREDPELSVIPIIAMTGKGGNDDSTEVEALTRGATDFIYKPYHATVIRRRVEGLIRLRETSALINQYRYDRLTGLCSKEYFCEQTEELLETHPDTAFDLLCIDICNFKLYNDIYGVEAGDRLLVLIAGKMKEEQERHKGICGRKIADRFMCIVERGECSEEEFNAFSEYINSSNDTGSSVRLVFGIFRVDDRELPVEMMIDRALLAASGIKRDYQRLYAVYDDSLRRKMLREREILQAVRQSVDKRHFEVYFQPKFLFRDGALAGAEALVRWNHPEMGSISPAEFIPVLERSGVISGLDRYVWSNVCCQLRKWNEKGYKTVPVSVNVSRADLYQEDLADRIEDLICGFGLDRSMLHLEITEGYYTENSGQVLTSVEKLWNKGFEIELDDFGSGYSSISMLSGMKLNYIKLDRQFIERETASEDKNGILKLITELSHNMGLKVIAEGVETEKQAELLKALGCDMVQGFYYGKPMPASEFEKLFSVS